MGTTPRIPPPPPGFEIVPETLVSIPQDPTRQGKPQLGFRNNNPGNLRFASQPGAEAGEGGFARFDSPESGFKALLGQIKLDASRGADLGAFIKKYAPPSENDTATYLEAAAKHLGVPATAPLSSLNHDRLAQFIAGRESSAQVIPPPPPGFQIVERVSVGPVAPPPGVPVRRFNPNAPGAIPEPDVTITPMPGARIQEQEVPPTSASANPFTPRFTPPFAGSSTAAFPEPSGYPPAARPLGPPVAAIPGTERTGLPGVPPPRVASRPKTPGEADRETAYNFWARALANARGAANAAVIDPLFGRKGIFSPAAYLIGYQPEAPTQVQIPEALSQPLIPISEFAVSPEGSPDPEKLRGALRGIEGITSPRDIAMLAAAPGLGAAAAGGLRATANLPVLATLLRNSPRLAKIFDAIANGAVPGMFAEEAVRGAIGEAAAAGEATVPEAQAEHVARALTDLAFGALAAKGAYEGGRAATELHPLAAAEIPAEPGARAQAFGEAKQTAAGLRKGGARLAAEQWLKRAENVATEEWSDIVGAQGVRIVYQGGNAKIDFTGLDQTGNKQYRVVNEETGADLFRGPAESLREFLKLSRQAVPGGAPEAEPNATEPAPKPKAKGPSPAGAGGPEAGPTVPATGAAYDTPRGKVTVTKLTGTGKATLVSFTQDTKAGPQKGQLPLARFNRMVAAARPEAPASEPAAPSAPAAEPPAPPPVPAPEAGAFVPPTVEELASVEAPQPWVLLPADYALWVNAARGGEPMPSEHEPDFRAWHKEQVRAALAAGQPVPDEIRSVYPDLAALGETAVAEPPQPQERAEAAERAPSTPESAEPVVPPPPPGFVVEPEAPVAPQPQGPPPAVALPEAPSSLRTEPPPEPLSEPKPKHRHAPGLWPVAPPSVTAPDKQTEIRNLKAGIADGEMRLRSGVNGIGEKLSRTELAAVWQSVENSRKRLAELTAEPPAPQAAREPWQMTAREYLDYTDAGDYPFGVSDDATERWQAIEAERKRLVGPRSGAEILKASEQHGRNFEHRWIVEAALHEGKPVPPEVLADYPDLQSPGRGAPAAVPPPGQPTSEARPVGAEAGAPVEPRPGQPEPLQGTQARAESVSAAPTPTGERQPPAMASAPEPAEASQVGEAEKKETGQRHDYSSTQVNLPDPVAYTIRNYAALIPDNRLAADGRETTPHVTVKYGLETADAEDVRKLLLTEGPITVKMGRASLFSNEDADVLKVDVDSPDLYRLNKLIADALPHSDTYPTYKPHATIAYLKPGEGKRYAGKPIKGITGKTVTLDRLVFSSKTGEQVEIPLTGKPGQPEPKPRSPTAKAREALARRRDLYTPGNIVFNSYSREHDKVLAYEEKPDHTWQVQVQAVDVEGSPKPGERPRWHSTEPDKGDRIVSQPSEPPIRKEEGVAQGKEPEVPSPAEAAAEKIEPAHPESKTGTQALADAVYNKLKAGESLGNVTEFNKLAEEHFGSGRTAGDWTPRDAFDAMETGVNRYLIERGKDLLGMDAGKGLAELRDLMDRITTQGTRTDDQIRNQQFSTPPTESYVAAKVARITPEDVVLEPSAGNGGLALWPKSVGAGIHANEISERRLDNLRSLGFGNPTAHDGEIINALLDASIKPTVVLMNPPFSAGTVKSHEAKNRNLYGFNHVESALQRLQPGGRLVAILGGGQANEPEGGASLNGAQSGAWFRKLAGQYNIRANVRIHGKEYQKYGTAFATRIIVIDKDGPTKDWAGIVKKNVGTLEEAYNVLRDVAESRPEIPARPAAGRGAREGEPRVGVAAGPGAARPEPGRVREREPEPAGAVQPGTGHAGPDRGVGAGEPGAGAEPAVRPEPEPPLARSDERPAAEGAGSPAEDLATRREAASEAGPEAGLSLARAESEAQPEQEDSDAYVAYRPTLKGAPHPGNIVETKTMSTVPMPEITYRPHLPASALESGAISAVQLEAIAIAGQANSTLLPGGFRASALIGDGTGVGKGRIAAGILWDNYRQGRKRLVWVSEKWDLMQDAMRDLNGIGATELLRGVTEQEGKFVLGADAAVVPFNKYNAKAKIEHDGVLFSTYALIRSENKKGDRRVAQLEEYLRGDDQGEGAYIVFDESHNLKNAVASQGGQESQIGKAVKELLERLPKLRTVSLSATAATDVINLGYLDRLGMWGPGTAFPSGFREFGAQIACGKLAAMELIARELKAQGRYVSRRLSFKGVEYFEVEHKLTPEQKDLYRTAAKAWASVFDSAEGTIKNTTNGGGRQIGNFHSQFYGAQQRFFNLLITTLKIPTAVEQATGALADGKSVVITLINTSEAAQNREKNKARDPGDDDDEIPDYDFGPKEMLVSLVREHYPVQQYKDDVDSAGNPVKVPVYTKDESGREIPVLNPEAVRQRDELIAQIERDLHLPENPLDILINSLGGEKKVAEITGRKERFDRSMGKFVPRGDPNVPRKEINIIEARAFQDGKKRIAILSAAGGSGISLHAGNDVKNQQRRYHITLQVGWSADKQFQFFGRTHRTNQASAPQYATLTSDLAGEKRFASTIARRMGSMGALVTGQANALTAGADLMEKVNFETEQGRQAANAFYSALLADQPVPGTHGLSGMQILTDLHVLKPTPDGRMTVPQADRTNVTRLLNRLLALDPDIQNAVYGYYFDVFTAIVKDAIERGTLDTGVRTLPGDEFNVKEQRVVSTDPKTGAETTYYPVEAKVRTHRLSLKGLEERLHKHRDDNPRILIDEHGKLRLAIAADPIVHVDARVEPASYFATPARGRWVKVSEQDLAGHRTQYSGEPARQKIEDWAADRLGKAQGEVRSAERALDWSRRDLEREQEEARDRVTMASQRKLEHAEAKFHALDEPPAGPGTVVYTGQRYKLLWEGTTRDGRKRARLENRSTGRDFWVDQREISRPPAPPADLDAAKREAQAEIETARTELEAARKQAESVRIPEDDSSKKRIAEGETRVSEAQKALAEAEGIAKDPVAWAKERWKEQYEAAPSHITEEHHLIGGAVMRWWNPISESTNIGYSIFTAVDSKTGQRVVGIDIPADRIKALLERITGGASTVTTSQLATDVLRNNLTYTLEGGIEVRRNRVGKDYVIQLTPPNQDVARNLVNLGAVHERGAVPIYYVPNQHKGPAEQTFYGILGKILDTYPIKPEESTQPEQPLMSRAEQRAGIGEGRARPPVSRRAAQIIDRLREAEEAPQQWENAMGAGYWVSPEGKATYLGSIGAVKTHPATAATLAKKHGLSQNEAMHELESAGWIRVRGEGIEATRAAINSPAFQTAVDLATQSASLRKLSHIYLDEYPWARHIAVPVGEAAEFAADPQAYLRAAGPMMSRAERPIEGFYSQLERVAESKLPERFFAPQAAAVLKNPQNGVKEDELKWTGVLDWLGQQGGRKIERGELLDQIRANQVEVREVVNGPVSGEADTKYEKYSTKGGEAYREVLLVLPKLDWRDPHWPDSGIVAWVRFKEFRDPQGNRVLLIDEIQSGLHQKGRDKGYATAAEKQELRKELEAADGEVRLWDNASFPRSFHYYNDPEKQARHEEAIQNWEQAKARLAEIKARLEAPPPAPFARTWHELAFRRVLRWAADNGFDQIAWTTGPQQAARYDLSQKVSAVAWQPSTGELYIKKKNAEDYDATPIAEDVTQDKIAEYVGKEGAQRLMALQPDDAGYHELSGKDLQVGGHAMNSFYDQILPQYAAKYGKKWGAQVGETRILIRPERIKAGLPERPGPVEPTGLPDLERGGYTVLRRGGELRGYYKREAQIQFDKHPEVEFYVIGDTAIMHTGLQQDPNGNAIYHRKSQGGRWSRASQQHRIRLPMEAAGPRQMLPAVPEKRLPAQTKIVHSLPITTAMRESVLAGQPLFARTRTSEKQTLERSRREQSLWFAGHGGALLAELPASERPEWSRAISLAKADLTRQGIPLPKPTASKDRSKADLGELIDEGRLLLRGTPNQEAAIRANKLYNLPLEERQAKRLLDLNGPILEGIPIPPLRVAAKLAVKELKIPESDRYASGWAGVAPEVDYRIRPGKEGRPTVLWMNGATAEAIRRAIQGDVQHGEFDGLLLEEQHLSVLERTLGGTGHTQLENLGADLGKLADEGAPVVAIRANTAAGAGGVRLAFAMYRHEGLHWLQTMLGGGRIRNALSREAVEDLLGTGESGPSIGAVARKALERRGYLDPPAKIVSEIAAHIGAGQFHQIGLTAYLAVEWYARYLAALEREHGGEAVESIIRLTHGRVREVIRGKRAAEETAGQIADRGPEGERGRAPPGAGVEEGAIERHERSGGPGARAGVDRPGAGEAVERIGGEEPLASKAEERNAPERLTAMPKGVSGRLDLDFFTLGVASEVARPFKPGAKAAFEAAHKQWAAIKEKADRWQTAYEANLQTYQDPALGATAEEAAQLAKRKTIKAIGPRPKFPTEPKAEQFTGPATKGQIRQLRTAQRKQDMPEDRFRELLKRETGKESTEELTGAEAIRFLENITALGVEQLGPTRFYNIVKGTHSPSWWLGRSEAGAKIYESAEKHWFEQEELATKLAKWWHKANADLSKDQVMTIGLYRDAKQLLDHYGGDKEKVKAIIAKGGEDPSVVDDIDTYLSSVEDLASKRWDEIFEWTRKKGVEAGFLPADLKIDTYLPFYYDEFFERHPEKMNAAAVDLAQELGIETTFAMQLLKQANAKNVKFGSFDIERTRWLLPGMRDPNKRFEIFSKGFARKMAVTAFLNEVNKTPGWFGKIADPKIKELAHEYINQYAGRPAYSGAGEDARIAGWLTGIQYAAKIGFNLFTPVLNLTQTVINTAPKYGYLRTAKAAARLPGTWGGIVGGTLGALLAGPPGTALGVPIGVALGSELYRLPRAINPFVRQMLELQRAGILETFHAKFERPHLHGLLEGVQAALGYLFDKSESENRAIAYMAGVDAAKAADAPRTEMVQAGRNAVRITQFFSGRLDAPLFGRTPVGKILMQFKTFQLKEIEFIRQLTPKQKLKFVLAVLVLAGPAALLIYQAMKRFMPDDEATQLMEEWQETYNVAAFLHAGKLSEQLGIYTIPGMESLGEWEYGNRLLKWAGGPTIAAMIDQIASAGRFAVAGEPLKEGPRGGRSAAEQFLVTTIRGWLPTGTELLRARRAMEEAKTPDEALRILVNFAEQKKKSTAPVPRRPATSGSTGRQGRPGRRARGSGR